MNAGITKDKSSDETILSEAKSFQAKYDDDYISYEDQIELLQQKELIKIVSMEI